MKKNILVCGLIGGLIISAFMIVSFAINGGSCDLENGMYYGYAAMILSFSLIFVGVKNYRDNYNNGMVTFGKAFKIGLYIALIASTCYVITWLIEYYFFVPDFMEKYSAHVLTKLKESGAAESEIIKQTAEMKSFNEMYKNPFVVIAFTYIEILPVGLIVSLISAAILRKKEIVEA